MKIYAPIIIDEIIASFTNGRGGPTIFIFKSIK